MGLIKIQETKSFEKYKKSGQVAAVNAIVILIIGVSVATLTLIFSGTLAGQTYSLTQDQIAGISDAAIKTSVENATKSGFLALQTTGQYLPVIVIAVVIFIVLGLLFSLQAFGGMSGGRSGGMNL
jgi:flagellar biosynthesis protein FlhB